MNPKLDYLLVIIHPHEEMDHLSLAKPGIQNLVDSDLFNPGNSIVVRGWSWFNDDIGSTYFCSLTQTYINHNFNEIDSPEWYDFYRAKIFSERCKSEWLKKASRYVIAGGNVSNCFTKGLGEISNIDGKRNLEYWISTESLYDEQDMSCESIISMVLVRLERFQKKIIASLNGNKLPIRISRFPWIPENTRDLTCNFFSSNKYLFEAIQSINN